MTITKLCGLARTDTELGKRDLPFGPFMEKLMIRQRLITDEPGPFDPLPMPSDRLSQHGEPDDDVEEEVIENCSQHSSMY